MNKSVEKENKKEEIKIPNGLPLPPTLPTPPPLKMKEDRMKEF